MKISKREKIMLVLMGIAVVGFLYYAFVFKHENNTIKKLQADYDNKKVLVLEGQGAEVKLQKTNRQIKELQKQIDVRKKKVSEPFRIPEILAELNAAAAQKSVKIDKIAFTGDSVKGEYKASSSAGSSDISQPASSAASNTAAQNANAGQSLSQEKIGTKMMAITFNFMGSYGSCLNLIKAFEDNKRLYIINDLQISGSNGICTGSMALGIVSVAEDASDFLYKVGGGTGRADPF